MDSAVGPLSEIVSLNYFSHPSGKKGGNFLTACFKDENDYSLVL